MLRAFRMETGMLVSGNMRNVFSRIARFALLAGAMFILCRAQPALTLAPLAMAFFASAIACAGNTAAMAAGGILGSIGSAGFNLNIPVGMAIILGGSLVWGGMEKRLKPGTSPPGFRKKLAGSILSGMAVLMPGMIAANGELWPSAQAMCAAIACAACAPFMEAAMEAGLGRRFLAREERLGFGIIICALAGGLAAACPPPAAFVGMLALLAAYPCGGALGAAIGAAWTLAGGPPGAFAMLSIGGMIARLMKDSSRYARSACAVIGAIGAAVYTGTGFGIAAGACLAGMAYILIPEKWAIRASAMAAGDYGAWDPDRLAAQLRRKTNQRLTALSAAFEELAEGYLRPCRMPDEQALIGNMRSCLCAGCASYGACWGGESNHGARFLCGLISEAVEWADRNDESPLFEGEIPPEIMRKCRRGRMIPERLSEMLEDFACRRRGELKRGGENRLISAQFMQARQMIDNIVEAQSRPARLKSRQADQAAAMLEKAGLPVENVIMPDGPGVEIIAALREGRWTRETAAMASAHFSRAFGRVYMPEGEYGREMRFTRRPCYQAETGVACVSRDAGIPSGDSHTACMIDDERMLFLICDGMGSGEEAARESAQAVRLLARFMKAGADSLLAIETVNALLLNRGGDDMFATVDMLVLNLSTGMAEFVKLAACPSLIVRNGDIYRVEGGRLPLGILERVQPAISRFQLLPGDIVFMASDGVMDAVDARQLEAGLRGAPGAMRDLARQALNLADGEGQSRRRDDMTALCLKFGERRNLRRAG